MRDPKPEKKAASGLIVEGLLGTRSRLRFSQMNVDDAGPDHELRCIREEPTRVYEWISSEGVGNPERSVSQLFYAFRKIGGFGIRHAVRPGPDADSSEFHLAPPEGSSP